MKNKIIYLLALLCLVPSLALAQSSIFVRNTSAATTLQNTNGKTSKASVDLKGRVFIVGSQYEDVTHASGDGGIQVLAVRNTLATSFGGAEQDYTPMSVTAEGAVFGVLDSLYQPNANRGIIKSEDAGHTTGDAGVAAWGIYQAQGAQVSPAGSVGDYTPFAVGFYGTVFTDINNDMIHSSYRATSIVKAEDVASANGDVGVAAYSVREDTLNRGTGSTGDYQPLKGDVVGRLITTLANPGETWSTCSSAETGTSNHAIKNGIASTRIYVTSISCSNTATVASALTFNDGSTTLYGGAIGNSTLAGVAGFQVTLPIPLRTAAAAPLNFLMGTTATNTVCCAAGYTAGE